MFFFTLESCFSSLSFLLIDILMIHLLNDLGIEKFVQIDTHKDFAEDEEGAEESTDIW